MIIGGIAAEAAIDNCCGHKTDVGRMKGRALGSHQGRGHVARTLAKVWIADALDPLSLRPSLPPSFSSLSPTWSVQYSLHCCCCCSTSSRHLSHKPCFTDCSWLPLAYPAFL